MSIAENYSINEKRHFRDTIRPLAPCYMDTKISSGGKRSASSCRLGTPGMGHDDLPIWQTRAPRPAFLISFRSVPTDAIGDSFSPVLFREGVPAIYVGRTRKSLRRNASHIIRFLISSRKVTRLGYSVRKRRIMRIKKRERNVEAQTERSLRLSNTSFTVGGDARTGPKLLKHSNFTSKREIICSRKNSFNELNCCWTP